MCSNCSGDYERPEGEEPQDELQELLEAYDERQTKAVKGAHSSWMSTKVMLEAMPFEVKF